MAHRSRNYSYLSIIADETDEVVSKVKVTFTLDYFHFLVVPRKWSKEGTSEEGDFDFPLL